jgi:hypothetical protein
MQRDRDHRGQTTLRFGFVVGSLTLSERNKQLLGHYLATTWPLLDHEIRHENALGCVSASFLTLLDELGAELLDLCGIGRLLV